MIDRIIDFSIRNKFIVIRPGGRRVHRGLVVHEAHDAGRHPGPERHPGHRLFPLGPQPGHHRRPGDLPHRLGHGGRAEGEGRPRVLRLRLLLRLRHLRGRHRHLLGPVAHPGVSVRRAAAAARRRQERDRAGCHTARLDLPVRPGGRDPGSTAWPRLRSYQDFYLKYYLQRGARCGRGGPGRGVREAVPGERGPEPAAGLRPLHQSRGGGGAGRQLRVGGPSHRVRRDRVQRPGPGIRLFRRGPGGDRRFGRAIRAHPSASRTSGRWWSGPTSAGESPISTARGTWSRASSSCGTGRMPWT